MNHYWKKYRWLISALLVLLMAFSGKTLFTHRDSPDEVASDVLKVLENKEQALAEILDQTIIQVGKNQGQNTIWTLANAEEYEKNGLALCIYQNDSLVYWSSSLVTIPHRNNRSDKAHRIRRFPTGWFLTTSKTTADYRIDGFVLIKRTFPYKNKYIRSSFHPDFHLPDSYEIKEQPTPESINITLRNGDYLFSLTDHSYRSFSEGNALFLSLFYLLFTIFLLTHLIQWLVRIRKIAPWIKTMTVMLISFGFYVIVNQGRFPEVIFSLDIFSPAFFAYGSWLPSLGEYALLSILMLLIAQSFFLFHEGPEPAAHRTLFRILLPHLFFGLYFTLSVFLFITLLDNSNISMEMFSNLRISSINILAFFSVSLQTLGAGIILIRLRCLSQAVNKYHFLFLPFGSALLFSILFQLFQLNITFYSLIFAAITIAFFFSIDATKIVRFRLTILLIFAVIAAMYLNLTAHRQIDQNRIKEQRLWSVNLASERDPAAEIFLTEFDSKIISDTVISRFLIPPYYNLENYLRNNYFTGFWRNYELQVTVCASTDTLLLEEEEKRFPCLDFFNNLKSTMGVLVPGSNFYFVNQLNGRISYLGELKFKSAPYAAAPLTVFVELYSKIIPEGKGYPQLLLDEQASRQSRNNGFSYAKYFGGRLVDRGGEYPYNLRPPTLTKPNQEFSYYKQAGYKHCVFHRGGDNFVVVSYPENSLLNRIGTFPYLFLLLYLIGFSWVVINKRNTAFGRKKMDLREKIQTTLVLTLLGILFIIGLGLIGYNYNEFRVTLKQNLEEKIRALSAEIELRIGSANELNAIRGGLNDQLIELSDITWTDINLYDMNGHLTSTSRSEIFDQGLTSRKMDPQAYKALAIEGRALFLHNENLGEMNFFSAYCPVYNLFDKQVGFVNLPYFSRQDDFIKEVSGFIVTFSNIYIFLILATLLIALVISNKLTAPLLRIEENLKGIELGKENTKIDYLGEDEIGRLAKEYNKKVDELAESAALLARSERESAWKEMARQIAHEINNPLTPMKLNIQYLQRIKEQGSENFDEYFNKVTRSLIEQIEVLSSIASAFSDFAKMSRVKPEPVDLAERIREVAFLFENSDECSIDLHLPEKEQIIIQGDKDQLGRALINLIKNGIQAVPANRKGLITIDLAQNNKTARITITDNGIGIPANIHDRLFEPSFTTKNSGMGLGLAITKRIIENMKGEIRFQTSPGRGTSFVVEIPVAE